MSQRYEHLTKPLKIRNTVLKSRFMYPCAQPHFLQGPELYPADPIVSYYCTIAKNGAAFIIVHDLANDSQRDMGGYDIPHFAMWDIHDKGCQNYFSHFAHMVHFYGTKLCTSLDLNLSTRYVVNEPVPGAGPGGQGGPGPAPMGFGGGTDKLAGSGLKFSFGSLVGPEGEDPNMKAVGVPQTSVKYLDEAAMEEYIGIVIDRMKLYADLGFDAAMVPTDVLTSFMSEKTNRRTDAYGGSLENRLRFSHKFFKAIRKALGNDFLLYCGAPISGGHGPMGGGLTDEEAVIWLKEMAPYLDLLYVRSAMGDGLMETECDCCPGAEQSAKLKAAGIQTPIAVSTPYMDLDKLEEVIASGKADVINSNHMFMCNPRLGEILKAGTGEDLEPCLLCHQCRGVSWTGEWMSHCTINPEMGMEYRVRKMREPVTKQKRIAIIGGGPGGMKAALYLKERGHVPVIFEASDSLGGQLKAVSCCDFKWRVTRYVNWLIGQMGRKDIEVRLNTPATREQLEKEDFDVIIAAVGGKAVLPDIPGIEHAWGTPYDAFGKEAELGKTVCVVGGASTAAEAAIYLARSGHEVVEISRKNIVAYELNPIRERGNVNMLSVNSGVTHIREASTVKLEPGKVYYVDKYGNEGTVECDSILVSGGVKPNRDGAIGFHGIAPEFYMIGDCKEAGNLRNAIFDAYAAAQQI